MGLKQLSHLSVNTGVATISREGIGPGVLRSITVNIRTDGTSKGEIHVRVTLQRGLADDVMAVATPIDDYIYNGYQPSWDGEIPLDPGDIIAVTTWASVARTIFCNVATSCGLTEAQSKAC